MKECKPSRTMKRRFSLLILLIMGLAPLRSSAEKPNVLLIVVDDLNTLPLGDTNRYAGKVVAPNIMRLAESGVSFTRCYAPSPKCVPSRTAFLSGIAPWRTGVYDNGADVRSSKALKGIVSLPAYFKQHGYYVASYGKVSHGWDLGTLDDSSGHKRDPHPPGAPLNGWAKAKGGKVTENDWGPTHLDENEMNDTEKANQAIAQLRKRHEKPFFIACGLFHPHMPAYAPQKYFDLYPIDSVRLPPSLEADLDDVPPIGKAWARDGAFQAIVEHGQWKEAVRGYLASVSYADAQIGRILDALAASPYKDNTIVVLISDNGFHIGEKEHWQKGTLWEEATHVLMIFRVPGLTQAGQVCKRTVTLLDLYPTLVELAGLPKPIHLDGHSVVPLLKNPNAPWSFAALSAYQSSMSVRTEDYRLIRYKDGTIELYDKAKDPHEWVNVANKPEYEEVQRKLLELLPAQDAMAPAAEGRRKNKAAAASD